MRSFKLPRRLPYILRSKYSTRVSHIQPPTQFTTSIFDIANDIPKSLPRSSNVQLTKFYQSIKTQDLELASVVLSEISTNALKLITNKSRNISIEFYFDCLKIILENYLNSSTFKPINLLRQNIEEYQNILSKFDEVLPEQEDIEISILKAIIHTYSISKKARLTSMFTIPIMEYFINVLNSFHIDVQKLYTSIQEEELRKYLVEICQIKDIKLVSVTTSTEKEFKEFNVPIDSYLDKYGGIDYDGICDYISDNKFKWNNKEIKTRLYQFYETLSKEEQEKFMDEYLQFNKVKEIAIESFTNRIVHASLKASKEFQRSFGFAQSEGDLLSEWISLVRDNINKLLNTKTPISDDDKTLQYFKPFLEVVTVESIASYVVQSLLGTGDNNRLQVILQKMRYSYPSILSQQGGSSKKNSTIFKYITDDSYNKLTEVFINVIVDNCKIFISEEEMEKFQNTVKLQDRTIPREFMINDGNNKYPAFYLAKEYNSTIGYPVYTIDIHPYLESILETFTTGTYFRYLPLLCPPKPWTNSQNGGYLNYQTRLIGTTDTLHKKLLEKAGVRGQLDSTYNCLDQIGNTPWAINPQMLDVFNKVIDYPNGFLEIPAIIPDPNLPSKERRELKNLRASIEITNKVANAFGKNGDLLYHCYMLDFRGRVYTFSPLTHYGSDLTRSLFLFWKSQPLGKNGFYWVKYQLASLFGIKNCEEFYEQNKEKIIDSAMNPLDGSRWWMKADKPFCALSVCFEIKNILDFQESGNDIQDYLSRLPIHQDGSCNGLQHYAALAADENGGEAVNLIGVGDSKQDVYIEVMKVVKGKIEKDIEDANLSEESIDLARFYLKILCRKLVKRPVMTTVYGVTLAGASAQIKSTIKEILDEHRTNPEINTFDQETLEKLSTFKLSDTMYLARKVLESIDELFGHAKQIETWLLQNTKRILTAYNVKLLDYVQEKDPQLYENIFKRSVSYTPMSWTAPSGFPVIQIYRQTKHKMSLGPMEELTIRNWNKLYPMDRYKHELAIAPNFIHSLDASHMFMTCDEANKQGITFSAIHDSYWTHPIHVDQLSRILREKFVELYSFDYLEYVKQDFIAQVKGSYQLVEFDPDCYPELAQKIKEIRKKYPERLKVHKLALELREMTEQGEEHIMRKLYHEYKPEVYHTVSTKTYHYLNELSAEVPKLHRNRVAMFVPVVILDVPPKGNLDITNVLNSKYFFS